MTKLTIVGGTEHTGEGPPVWEADDGVERVLRTGIAEDLSDVVIIGLSKSNTVFVASSTETIEFAVGIVERGKTFMIECTSIPDEESETAGS